MSYPYPNLNSYQTSNPNPPQQPGQYIQPGQFVQPGQPLPNAYNDAGQQGILFHFFFLSNVDGLMVSSLAYSYPEGSFQPQSSGQRHSSRSPNVGNINIPFPEPHGGSAGHPQVYFPPSQTTPNLAVPTHIQHGRRGSHGNSPTGSYSDRQGLYSASVGSDTGSGSNFYSPQSGVQPQNYAAIAPQPQAVYDEGHDSRLKGPAPGPVRGTRK